MQTEKLKTMLSLYFENYGISQETIDEFHLNVIQDYSSNKYPEPHNVIKYDYNFYNEHAENCSKFQSIEHPKNYSLSDNFKKALYNFYHFAKEASVIITKNELDVLTWHECGITSVGSLPPNPAKPISVINDIPEYDFSYLNNCSKGLINKKQIYFDLGDSQNGELMRAELARRLGKDRVYIIKLPEPFACANDVLLTHGKEAATEILQTCLADAKPYPIVGIEYANDSLSGLLDIYDNGFPNGADTDWTEFNKHVVFYTRMFVLLTGIASDGKSTWLDNLLVQLMRRHNWKVGIFSPEYSETRIHLMKLARIMTKQSFLPQYNNRMSREKVIECVEYIDKMMFWMRPKYKDSTLDFLLETARCLVLQHGIKILVFDPAVSITGFFTGTVEHLIENLNKLREFEREYDVLLIMVAHPTKLPRVKPGSSITPAPRLDDISGGANWQNVIDVGLVFYQYWDEKTKSNTPFMYIKKVREDHVGKKGVVQFKYDAATQTLEEDIQQEEIDVPIKVDKSYDSTFPVRSYYEKEKDEDDPRF